jgi:hypothetical protein
LRTCRTWLRDREQCRQMEFPELSHSWAKHEGLYRTYTVQTSVPETQKSRDCMEKSMCRKLRTIRAWTIRIIKAGAVRIIRAQTEAIIQ